MPDRCTIGQALRTALNSHGVMPGGGASGAPGPAGTGQEQQQQQQSPSVPDSMHDLPSGQTGKIDAMGKSGQGKAAAASRAGRRRRPDRWLLAGLPPPRGPGLGVQLPPSPQAPHANETPCCWWVQRR